MAQNKVELELGNSQAIQSLDVLQRKIQELTAQARELASTLGPGAASDPRFREAVQGIAGATGAMTAAQSVVGSAGIGAGIASSQLNAAMVAGAKQATSQLGRTPGGFGPESAILTAQQLGAGVTYTPPFNAAAFVASIVAGSAPPSGGGGGARFAGYGAGGPPPFEIGGPGQALVPYRPMPGPRGVGPGGPGPGGGNGPWPAGIGQSLDGPFGSWNTMDRVMDMFSGASYGQLRTAAYGIGIGAYSALSTSTGERVSGHVDIMGRARTVGMILGGGLGMMSRNPYVAATTAMFGGEVSSWLAAPMERASQIASGMGSLQGLAGSGWAGARRWAETTGGRLQVALDAEGGGRSISPQAVASAASTAYTALMAGGINPESPTRSGPFGTARPQFDPDARVPSIAYTIELAQTLIQNLPLPGDSLYKAITRRVGALYTGDEAINDVMNRIAPIWGTASYTQGNVADIATKYGPTATLQYLQSTVDPTPHIQRGMNFLGMGRSDKLTFTSGAIPVSKEELVAFAGRSQEIERERALAMTQVRGSASAVENAYRSQMASLATLPGGESSVSYAEAGARARSAGMAAFAQASTTAYDIPATRLDAARAISMVSPYGPGNRMGIEAQSVALAQNQLGRVRAFMARRRADGELSESDELELTQQEARLQVAIAQGIATMSEGVADRLPSLMAGRPGGFARFDSSTLASANFMRIGAPRRSEGAVNGAQLRMQDDFIRSMGLSAGGASPYSRLSGGGEGAGMVEKLLQSIVDEVRALRMGGGGSKPGETRGAVAGALSGKWPAATDRGF